MRRLSLPGILPRISRDEGRMLVFWLAVALLLHLFAAWLSVGWHSADEHFQILEFANYKLGRTPQAVLAVEFPERMRPWLQPAIYWAMAKTWLAFGVDDPSKWVISFRVFAALVGWLSLVALSLCAFLWFPGRKVRRFAILSAALLAFLPALHARPSSENLGGSALVLGLCIFELARARGEGRSAWGWIAGIVMGAAFEFRFQVGIMVMGYLAWLLFRARLSFKSLTPVLGGILLAFALGRTTDAWAYGSPTAWEWVLSPWHYVRFNLIENRVNLFGVNPWWDVFRMSFTESWPLLGTALAVGVVLAWIKSPGHALTWATLPFFLVHESIGHKELRFFFPIVSAAPALLALLLQSTSRWVESILKSRPCAAAWALFKWNNGVALLALTFVPFSRVALFQEAVWHAVPEKLKGKPESFELYTNGRDPFEVLGTQTYFYRPPELKVISFTQWPKFELAVAQRGPIWLFQAQFDLEGPARLRELCVREFRTLPDWVKNFNYFGWLDRTNIWSLYRCGGPDRPVIRKPRKV